MGLYVFGLRRFVAKWRDVRTAIPSTLERRIKSCSARTIPARGPEGDRHMSPGNRWIVELLVCLVVVCLVSLALHALAAA